MIKGMCYKKCTSQDLGMITALYLWCVVMAIHVEQGHGAKLHVGLRPTCKKHKPCSTIGPLTLLL